ncbi:MULTISPECIES: hypothetical protein [Pontibacillus]|uniref:Uncharacterized protein n=1 Tax=Pontibacillus chungwhensis TaxID=265426 RepID=A0ABY8V509_9BACI|nr:MULTISPECIES: hypothetical protein [Pontibacillus]MCD5326154.1 hypothetical protein [Pontibacillus sp. HN14]WIG00288.1 hypothetical protein QNI29_21010 [Pontibacillus chungwhensis]
MNKTIFNMEGLTLLEEGEKVCKPDFVEYVEANFDVKEDENGEKVFTFK